MSELHTRKTMLQEEGDRRMLPRRRTLLSGKIVSCDGRRTSDCTIRNLTNLGAKIFLPATLSFGADCFLVIPQRSVAHAARIAWRRANVAGLKFGGSTYLDRCSDPYLAFLASYHDGRRPPPN